MQTHRCAQCWRAHPAPMVLRRHLPVLAFADVAPDVAPSGTPGVPGPVAGPCTLCRHCPAPQRGWAVPGRGRAWGWGVRREDLQGHQPRSQALRVRPREQQSWAGHIPWLPPTAHLQGTWDRAGGTARCWASGSSPAKLGSTLIGRRPLGQITSGSRWLGPHRLLLGRRGSEVWRGFLLLPPSPARCQADTQAPGQGCIPALPPQPRAQHHLLRCQEGGVSGGQAAGRGLRTHLPQDSSSGCGGGGSAGTKWAAPWGQGHFS